MTATPSPGGKRRLLVVGASLAGLRVVEAIRSVGCDDQIIMIGEEMYPPYDRPPLSKEFLTKPLDSQDVLLRDGDLGSLDVQVELGKRAVGVDRSMKRVGLSDGKSIQYDELVIATGARARRLPALDGLPGVHYLRTLDDAVALRDALDGAGRVVVVGAGFIGSEVASSACARGCDVTVLEATASPMSRVFGHDMGTRIGALHRHSGSELRCGVAVVGAEAKQSRVKIRLSDSSAIEADVVVVGVGSVPNSEWLSSSFDLSGDGVACDSRGRVRGDDGVHALGDVASWASERYGDCQRSEHWTSAGDQAVVVAADIVGRTGPDEAVPYVWSDQFSHRIQVCGRWFPDAQVRVLRDEGVSLLAISGRGGRLEGAVSIDDAKGFATLRRALIRGSSLEMAAGTISALLS